MIGAPIKSDFLKRFININKTDKYVHCNQNLDEKEIEIIKKIAKYKFDSYWLNKLSDQVSNIVLKKCFKRYFNRSISQTCLRFKKIIVCLKINTLETTQMLKHLHLYSWIQDKLVNVSF